MSLTIVPAQEAWHSSGLHTHPMICKNGSLQQRQLQHQLACHGSSSSPDTPQVEDALQDLLHGRLRKEGHLWGSPGGVHLHLLSRWVHEATCHVTSRPVTMLTCMHASTMRESTSSSSMLKLGPCRALVGRTHSMWGGVGVGQRAMIKRAQAAASDPASDTHTVR